MTNVTLKKGSEISVEDVVDILQRGGAHCSLGMRGYYPSIPPLARLFGPLWLLAGTLVLLTALCRFDRGV